MHFQKSYVRAKKWDVQDTDISLTQLNRSWHNFSWCRFTHGRNSRAWSLGLSDWSISLFTKPIQQVQRSVTGKPASTIKTKFQPSTTILIWAMLITFHLTWNVLDLVLCCTYLRKPWLRWWSKAEVQQWDMCQEPTELLLIGCSTGTSTPNINSQTYWLKGFSHVTNGTILFICLTSAISALFVALRISVWPATMAKRCTS